jgi:uncharacterized protein YebE (UPF0316 family)
MTDLLQWLDQAPPFVWPLFIFFARVTDVTIGTMRTITVVRGYRFVAALLGFVEVIIWLVAVSGVISHGLTLGKMLAYGAGFAAGNATGVWVEQKLALGKQLVRLLSRHRGRAIAEGLRLAGYIVTEVPARGVKGEVALCFVVVPRQQCPQVLAIAQRIDPDVLDTVEDLRHVRLSRHVGPANPTGWRSILKKK